MFKSVAIIPARGGSKRIPRKNIKLFHGTPLIAYSIQVAQKSGLFEKIIVTTDDDEIGKIAQQYGAIVHPRPTHLSDDFTTIQPVIDDVLDSLEQSGEKYDYLCTLFATAPLLQEKYLCEGLEKLDKSDAVNAFSVTSMPFPIQRTFKITKDERCEMFWPQNALVRSQDLEEAYQDAGQFYWTKIGKKSDEFMFGSDSIPIILPRYLVQDIDTLEDWKRAEYIYEAIQRENDENR
jgi:pseudaminic acid cytidylyltransferase